MGGTVSTEVDAPDQVFSKAVTEAKEGETPIYRNVKSLDKLVTCDTNPKFDTLYSAFNEALKAYGTSPMLGERHVGEDGKLGPFEYESFEDIGRRRTNLGSGLFKLGVVAGGKVAIYSRTRLEWMLTDIASHAYSICLVPLYDTLGKDSVQYVLAHSESTVAITEKKGLRKILDVIEETGVKKLVQVEDDVDVADKEEAENKGIEVYTLKEVEKLGEENPADHVPPTPDTIFSIIYTSGTAGVPKGVIHTHGSMMATNAALAIQGYVFTQEDTYIAFLPLAHVFERMVEAQLFFSGAKICYYSGDLLKILDDIETAKPTIFVAVPRVLDKMKAKILRGVDEGGAIKKTLFNTALSSKSYAVAKNRHPRGFWESMVFSKVREVFGGNIRLVISGSAPLDKETNMFMKCCITKDTVEGYGLTETMAITTAQVYQNDYKLGCIGAPFACNEVKFADIPDMNYFAKDEPNPRGEICVRGSNVFKGYYKQDDLTKDSFDEDGFFKTGDVGEFLPDGTIKIIDRKKNIFKLAQGEYIAVEFVETICRRSEYALQVWVYGDSHKPCLVAVVVPDPEALKELLHHHKLDKDMSREDACKNEAVHKAILQSLLNEAKKEKLSSFETPKAIYLEPIEFSVDNDLLTPSSKLRRQNLLAKYENVIDDLYVDADKLMKGKEKKI